MLKKYVFLFTLAVLGAINVNADDHYLLDSSMSFAAPVIFNRSILTDATSGTIIYDSQAGNFYGLPPGVDPSVGINWIQLGITNIPTNNYYSGYFSNGAEWTTTSGTFADYSSIGSAPTLNTRVANGITVTAAAGNLPGITFTPSSASAVYEITVTITMSGTSGGSDYAFQLTDGSTVISSANEQHPAATAIPFTMTGVYAPGSTSPVTVKIQGAASAGTNVLYAPSSLGTVGEWKIVQIK